MKSEIIDEYLKIAQEKGWDKTVITKSAKDRTDGTDYQDKIRALYGIETKVNDKKEDIIDQAHPESVFIAPAYDAVNGRVENIKERQDVISGIATRQPKGQLDGHKYANESLVHELLKVGFDLKQHPELQKESDMLLQDVVADLEDQAIKKVAFWDLIVKGLGFVAGIALLYNAFHVNFIGTYSSVDIPQGADDATVALKEVQVLMDPHMKIRSEEQISVMDKFVELTKEMIPIVEKLPVTDPKDILNGTVQKKTLTNDDKQNISILNQYAKNCKIMVEYTEETISQLNSASINKPSGSGDAWNTAMQVGSRLWGRGRTYLYPINTLSSLLSSIKKFLEKTSKAFKMEDMTSKPSQTSIFNKPTAATPTAPTAATAATPTAAAPTSAATPTVVQPTPIKPATVQSPTPTKPKPKLKPVDKNDGLTDQEVLERGW